MYLCHWSSSQRKESAMWVSPKAQGFLLFIQPGRDGLFVCFSWLLKIQGLFLFSSPPEVSGSVRNSRTIVLPLCVCDWGHSSEHECFLKWALIVLEPGVLQCSYWGSQPQRVERRLLSDGMECYATKLAVWNSWPNSRFFGFFLWGSCFGLFCVFPVLVWHSRCFLA